MSTTHPQRDSKMHKHKTRQKPPDTQTPYTLTELKPDANNGVFRECYVIRSRSLDKDMNLGTLEDREGHGVLVCCSPWGHKDSDMT